MTLVTMVFRELLVRRDQWGLQDQLDLQDQKDQMVRLGKMAYLDMLANEESRVFKAKPVFQGQLELWGLRANLEKPALWEREVTQDHRDLLVNMDCQVLPDVKVQRVTLVLPESLVSLDLKG